MIRVCTHQNTLTRDVDVYHYPTECDIDLAERQIFLTGHSVWSECVLGSSISNGFYRVYVYILNAISYAPYILLMIAEVNEKQFTRFSFQFIKHL